MKRILLLLVVTSFGLLNATAQTTVIIKKGKFKVADASVTPNWKLSDVQAKIGPAERPRDGYNKTHTYDVRGIVLFEKMEDKTPSGKISEVQCYFSVPEPNNVTPKGTFTGTLKVDKLEVTGSLTATEMLKKLKKWKKTDSYLEHSYRMASKGLYIYFQFNDDETRLVKLSCGPDLRKDK